MNERRVEVRTGSRLHFGMLAFGQPSGRQFGGVGVMIDRPGVRLVLRESGGLEVRGPLDRRGRRTAARVLRQLGVSTDGGPLIEVVSAPPAHAGLGSGTQFDLAVAAGLSALVEGRPAPLERLVEWTGRGRRSAVGCYGFRYGGLIVESGKLPGERLAPLVARLAVPRQWRFVLLLPRRARGLHGAAERVAFEQLPPVPERLTERLCEELLRHLLPAVARGDFSAFAASMDRYGRLAGKCFEAVQGGLFASSELEQLAHRLARLGAPAVGQSSWGPGLFVPVASKAEAESLVAAVRGERAMRESLRIAVARPLNRGVGLRTGAAVEERPRPLSR